MVARHKGSRAFALAGVVLALFLGAGPTAPGTINAGGPATMHRAAIRANLAAHLEYLSVRLGERSIYRPQNLQAAERYVFDTFTRLGYPPRRQTFSYLNQEVSNVIAGEEQPGGYYILGAHFDTVAGTPGADDNASGVAVLLEVARLARGLALPRPWAFIGFTTEEPPAFSTPYMGSRVYAQGARRERRRLLGMLCLEMVGYYSREPGSQALPLVPASPGVSHHRQLPGSGEQPGLQTAASAAG